MDRIKVYLDTSAVSCLDAPETPERMIHTQLFWDTAKRGEYEIVVSDVMLDELNDCPEPKRSFLYLKLAELPFIARVESDELAKQVAMMYTDVGGLPPASKADALHLAIATLEKCDYVASWNLKHMANIRAQKAVTAVNQREGYNLIEIKLPSTLIIDEEDSK
ncbi:MAG: PIN domain nuclease [Oscillospiraceae bacterium]|nr:PIN domain nuclease [Oscillospiraceae bacterium]